MADKRSGLHIYQSGHVEYSNSCHNPAGPGGGQFCGGSDSSSGGQKSEWKVANTVSEAKQQFKDKFGDVFKSQGVEGNVRELNAVGHETSRPPETRKRMSQAQHLRYQREREARNGSQ